MSEICQLTDLFTDKARKVGATVLALPTLAAAAAYIHQHGGERIMLPAQTSLARADFAGRLRTAGAPVITTDLRRHAPTATAGVTAANFALADTGSVVLESTPEEIRLATTLPERHFVLLDPRKILADGLAAVKPLRDLHAANPRCYVAYITGPSRTADIERVLTIGVHGPRQLDILLVDGLSDDLLEL